MKPTNVDEYIAAFEPETREHLQHVGDTIRAAAPESVEVIRYGIPTYQIGGKSIVHFGGYAKHIGFYATPDGHAQFEPELSNYKRGKGSVQFPLNQPVPYDLIKRIVTYRVNQHVSRPQ